MPGPFDDTDGPDDRHELVAWSIKDSLEDGSFSPPIEIDDYYIDHVHGTGKPIWDERHVENIIEYLDELVPGHPVTEYDFQDPPDERESEPRSKYSMYGVPQSLIGRRRPGESEDDWLDRVYSVEIPRIKKNMPKCRLE